jgi:hypothetical protein
MSRYELHGLSVESELALDARPGDRPADLRVRLGAECAAPQSPPPGRLLAERHIGNIHFWLAEGHDGQWTFRYPELGDVIVDPASKAIEARPAAGRDPGLVAIVVAGSVLAHLLSAEGALVLHASCVELSGRALAIAGHSGGGKSTLAALCCAAGARLVTDDAMRLVDRAQVPECVPGSTALRLRRAARAIAERIDGVSVSESPDDRLAVRPSLAPDGPVPLAGIVVPELSREADDLIVERLDVRDAMIELLRYPRVGGWRAPSPIRGHFAAASELAESIPIHRAVVPWRPSPPTEIGAQLLLIATDAPAKEPA